jgi:co-chaperonin GroES (HSP10)
MINTLEPPIKIDDENHLIIDIKDIIAMIEEY